MDAHVWNLAISVLTQSQALSRVPCGDEASLTRVQHLSCAPELCPVVTAILCSQIHLVSCALCPYPRLTAAQDRNGVNSLQQENKAQRGQAT